MPFLSALHVLTHFILRKSFPPMFLFSEEKTDPDKLNNFAKVTYLLSSERGTDLNLNLDPDLEFE